MFLNLGLEPNKDIIKMQKVLKLKNGLFFFYYKKSLIMKNPLLQLILGVYKISYFFILAPKSLWNL
jgi:hypothetical protein